MTSVSSRTYDAFRRKVNFFENGSWPIGTLHENNWITDGKLWIFPYTLKYHLRTIRACLVQIRWCVREFFRISKNLNLALVGNKVDLEASTHQATIIRGEIGFSWISPERLKIQPKHWKIHPTGYVLRFRTEWTRFRPERFTRSEKKSHFLKFPFLSLALLKKAFFAKIFVGKENRENYRKNSLSSPT